MDFCYPLDQYLQQGQLSSSFACSASSSRSLDWDVEGRERFLLCFRTIISPHPQLVFNFLLNKMLKISTWEPSKCSAIIIILLHLVQEKVNILLLENSIFLSHPPQNKMYLYHPPYHTICSQTSVFIQKLLEFSQQTLLQRNKELQLTPR